MLPYLEVTGNAVAYNQVDLEARVQGYLQEINYQDGAEAKKADTLFVIEPAPYQAQLQQAQATLAATQADLVQAEAEFTRQFTLGKSDFASQSKVDEARAKRDSDKAQILNNQAGVTIAAINLGYTQVTAPFDGRVTAHLVSVGGLVGVTGPTKLATIVQLDPIYATFTVSEQQVLRVKEAMVKSGFKPGEFKGIPVEVGLMTEDGLSACRQARLRRADARSIDRHADRPRHIATTRTGPCCPACSCASAFHWRWRRRTRFWCPMRRSGPTRAAATCWSWTRTMWCSSGPCRPGNWRASSA